MNTMKNTLNFKMPKIGIFSVAVGIITVLVVGLSGCGPKEPISIGVLGTFSGSNSDLSVSGRRGIEMAAAEINASGGIGGRRVELIAKDDANDPVQALSAFKELQTEGVHVVIGPYTSGMAMSIFEALNQSKVLTLSPTVSADTLSGKADYFVRFIASTKEQAEILSEVAKNRAHKRIAVVYDSRNKGFTDQLLKNYNDKIISKMGLEVQSMAYNPEIQAETTAALQWVQSEKPEGLFIIASAEACASLAQQLKPSMPSLQLYGPLWSNTPELIHKGGAAVEGMVVVGGLDVTNDREALVRFRDNYFKEYGVEATFASVYSYEAFMALRQALEQVNPIDATAIRDALIKIKKFEVLQQTFEIDANGDNTRAYLVYEIQNGQLKKVE